MCLSKTRAIRKSAGCVFICGSRTSWQITAPWDIGQLNGPSTSYTACSYPEAVLRARRIRANIVLHLMGALDENSAWAVYCAGPEPITSLVDLGLTAYKAFQK